MTHTIQCSCGALKGTLDHPATFNRGICYCYDCQAFAHFLRRPHDVLDLQGGTDILQMSPKHLTFTQGAEKLACMRLSEKGLMRWYARCCNTPIGNTVNNSKLAFVGLIHNCLAQGQASLNADFGPVEAYINTKSARGQPKPAAKGMGRALLRISGMMLRARIDGSYRQTPFFDTASGKPVVQPLVLTVPQRQELMNRVKDEQAASN